MLQGGDPSLEMKVKAGYILIMSHKIEHIGLYPYQHFPNFP